MIDIAEDPDIDMGDPTEEPLPFDGGDESWHTDNEEGEDGAKDGEEIIQHYLGDHSNENRHQMHCSGQTVSYRERLEWEQKNWRDIQAELVDAYMGFMLNGPTNGQGNSIADGEVYKWFTCEVSTLQGAVYARSLHYRQ
jgi:hypothetical protein